MIKEFEFEDMGKCSVGYADVYGQWCSVDLQVTASVSEVECDNGVGHIWHEYEIKIESCHAFFIDQDGGSRDDDDSFSEYTHKELEELVLKEVLRG